MLKDEEKERWTARMVARNMDCDMMVAGGDCGLSWLGEDQLSLIISLIRKQTLTLLK